MQTYTHALIGTCLAATAFDTSLVTAAACCLGSVLPDVVQMPKYALDKLKGKKPLEHVSSNLLLLKNIAHSLFFWLTGLILALATDTTLMAALFLGGLAHVIVDALTHCDPHYEYDAGFLWPLDIKLATYTGIWDYRIGQGVLRPKLPEAIVDALALLIIVLVYF